MKRSEREALKNAFNIPEPQNKDSFAANYERLFKKNQRRLRFPVYMKYASTAVFAALVIGVWGHMTVSRDYIDKYKNGNLTQETTVTTTAADTQPSTEIGGEDKNSVVTEVFVQTAETNIPDPTQTVTTVLGNSETLENTENNSEEENNEEEPEVTSAQTANANRETTTAAVVTTAAVTSKPGIKTTASVNVPPPIATTCNSTIHMPRTTACADEPVLDVTEPSDEPAPPMSPQTTRQNDNASKPIETTEAVEFSPSPGGDTSSISWIIPTVKYEKTDKYIGINELNGSACAPGASTPPEGSDFNSSWDISKLFERSKYIIAAEAVETIYTAVDNLPYTQYDLITNCCYKRDEKYPQTLSVYVPGGYIPADVYSECWHIENHLPDDVMLYSDGGNKGEIKLYQQYIFFINDGLYNMPDGSYCLTAETDISIFAYDGEKYVSLGNPSLTFTEKELSYLT